MNDKAVIAKEEVNQLLSPSVLQRKMINVTDSTLLDNKIKNHFEDDSRCVLRNMEEHLLIVSGLGRVALTSTSSAIRC